MANFRRLSRYSNRTIETARDGKRFIVLREPIELEPAAGDIYVTITQEVLQRPDLIASRAYGAANRELWWIIYEFNGISDPLFELKLGQTIRIPALSRVQEVILNRR